MRVSQQLKWRHLARAVARRDEQAFHRFGTSPLNILRKEDRFEYRPIERFSGADCGWDAV